MSESLRTLATLHHWADRGWLRRLDSALAALMHTLDPHASPALLVATAFLAHREGHGDTCLPLQTLAGQPSEGEAWPAAALAERQALWQQLPQTASDWVSDLRASPLVRIADASDDQGQPLVLRPDGAAPLLYLRRFWLHEQAVGQQLRQRCLQPMPVDEGRAAQWLERLFAPQGAAVAAAPEVDWQRLACALALRAGLTVVTGGPGTGKTYTAARLLTLLLAMSDTPERLRIALAAPTGKAAARLRQAIDGALHALAGRLGESLDLPALAQRMGPGQTLHALLGARLETRAMRFDAAHPLDVDILVVDEASMVHLEMMSALLQALPPGARLILLGDKDQLASVEAGAVLGDVCRDAAQGQYSAETARYAQACAGQTLPARFLAGPATLPSPLAQQTVMLRQSHRFGGLIGQLAEAVNSGQDALAHSLLRSDAGGVLYAPAQPGLEHVLRLAVAHRPLDGTGPGVRASYADYLQQVQAGPLPPTATTDAVAQHSAWATRVLQAFDRFRLLCPVHARDWGTQALNAAVQKALEQAGWLRPRGEWFVGRPVMVTRNNPSLGVFNGDVGVTLPGPAGSTGLRVYFLEGERLRGVGVGRLADVETAFAMTVHKSQGSEFLHTALVLGPGSAPLLTRELVYTGITRAREQFSLLEAQEGLLSSAMARRAQRASGLAALLA